MAVKGKKILLGVSGSIAAYKIPNLVRLLVKAGAEVKVVMTKDAKSIVSPLTLATVSKNDVLSDVHDGDAWNNHVELGLWADLMLIAPCSANTLAKLAHGICDNILTAVYLSAKCPVWVAPAMDLDMWAHFTTQNNIQLLQKNNIRVLEVGYGELASGLVGAGRMLEPEALFTLIKLADPTPRLLGKKVVVTAGPTYEKIDPVRFIGNFSTGKMGIAIAEAFAHEGATVELVLGPTPLQPLPHPHINVHAVESADEMYDKVMSVVEHCDAAVMSAAVADYKVKNKASKKIKKAEQPLVLELEENKDILAAVGALKQKHQFVIGFALETNDALTHAKSKLIKKNADLIVLNSLADEGAGFGHDTNKVTFVFANDKIQEWPLMSKQSVAEKIVEVYVEHA